MSLKQWRCRQVSPAYYVLWEVTSSAETERRRRRRRKRRRSSNAIFSN